MSTTRKNEMKERKVKGNEMKAGEDDWGEVSGGGCAIPPNQTKPICIHQAKNLTSEIN
jgi:hypothetical protein